MAETVTLENVKTSKSRMKILRCSKNAKRIYIPSDIGSDSQFPLDEDAKVSIVKVNGKLAVLVEASE